VGEAGVQRCFIMGASQFLVIACFAREGRRLRRAGCGVQPGTSQATALHQTKTEMRRFIIVRQYPP
jgi:hypothetical protein